MLDVFGVNRVKERVDAMPRELMWWYGRLELSAPFVVFVYATSIPSSGTGQRERERERDVQRGKGLSFVRRLSLVLQVLLQSVVLVNTSVTDCFVATWYRLPTERHYGC